MQIATKFSHAPVAYSLSAFAAVVYILATVTLTAGRPVARRIAVVSCSVELAGVLAVGTWSLADPATFPDATVWSGYGSGYGFVPLVLPILGLLWLRRWSRRSRAQRMTLPAAGGAGEAASGGADRLERRLHEVHLGVIRLVVDELIAGGAVPADLDGSAAGEVTPGVGLARCACSPSGRAGGAPRRVRCLRR